MGAHEEEEDEAPSARKRRTQKDVHFSILPDKYEPLIEEEEQEETPQERRRRKEKKRKKKEKYKKYRKVRRNDYL